MSNLHDVTWGNRPAAGQATAQFTAVAKKQMELDKDYKMYRVNGLAYWIILNTAYVFFLTYINDMKVTSVNDGKIHQIDGIAMFLAGIVLYKVTFDSIHILWIKFRVMCRQDMKV